MDSLHFPARGGENYKTTEGSEVCTEVTERISPRSLCVFSLCSSVVSVFIQKGKKSLSNPLIPGSTPSRLPAADRVSHHCIFARG